MSSSSSSSLSAQMPLVRPNTYPSQHDIIPHSSLMAPIELVSSTTAPRLLPPLTTRSAMRAQPPKRRPNPYQAALHRRRPLTRPTTRLPEQQQPPVHPFDRLPWSSLLHLDPHTCDLADLSQLLLPDCPSSPSPRRQRSSLHSSQLRAITPPCDTLLLPFPSDSLPSRPSTPPSRFNPSRVLFHNLMPVLFDSDNDTDDDDPSNCTFKPPIHLH